MSEDQKLQELSLKLKDTVDRIDKMQQKPSFTARLGRHIRMQSNSIIHAMLAGCIFTVALGRLAQKNEFEVSLQPARLPGNSSTVLFGELHRQ